MAIVVERVQTGMRIEKRILKVLKATADGYDMTLGDLIEGIVLHAFEGKVPFSAESLRNIAELKKIFRLDLTAGDSHRLREKPPAPEPPKKKSSAGKKTAKKSAANKKATP
jgi:hypothetical protein